MGKLCRSASKREKKKVYRKQKRKEKAVCLSLIKNKIKVIRGGEILNRADSHSIHK